MADYLKHARKISPETGPFSDEGWRTCSAKSLRGHLVNAHFQATTLFNVGVPRYDIEIAEVRGIGLGWVVKRAVEKLAQPNIAIRAEIGSFAHDGNEVFGPIDETTYRSMLVKSIRLIHNLRLAHVPWAQIDEVYPEASAVPLDLSKDTTDASFKSLHSEEPLVVEAERRRRADWLAQQMPVNHEAFAVRL